VGRQQKSREPDEPGHTVRDIGNPTMISIAAGDDRRYRECRDRMADDCLSKLP
jgi:hypothetical protein